MSNDLITVGSKTSTGGKVISGNAGVVINGQQVALVGDMATCNCGKKSCRGQGPIVSTSPRNAGINGVAFAKANDFVDTGCGSCFLLPSAHSVSLGTVTSTPLNVGSGVSFGNNVNINQGVSLASSGSSAHIAGQLARETETEIRGQLSSGRPTSTNPTDSVKQATEQTTEFYLGWLQVERTQNQAQLWSELFSSDTSEEQKQLVKKYNSHLNNPVRQGEIVILPTAEPETLEEQEQLDALTEESKAASTELAKLSEEELATVNRHFELLDYYAFQALQKVEFDGLPSGQYAYASVGVGAIASGVEQHLKNINAVLSEINDLYVAHVAMASRTGGINYGPFVAQRASLFKKLDGTFAALSKRSVQIPAYRQVKRSLKLSTRSVIHNATEISAKGIVPNLGKRMAKISVGISASKGVWYVGLILGGASSAKSIYEACSVDSSGQCGKVTTREVGGFIGGWGAGIAGGNLAASGTLLVLGLVGITSPPVLAIGAIGAFVAGGAAGGVVGSTVGKAAGDTAYFIHNWVGNYLE